ncbi:MAG: cysteine desulfurase family protein [Phycisphaerales bacterium]
MLSYLDNNATTQPLPEVIEAMTAALRETWCNPSSVHRGGQAARREIELARQSVAELLTAQPRDIVFTSGGTESSNIALRSAVTRSTGRSAAQTPLVLSTALEHVATRETIEHIERSGQCQGQIVACNNHGVIDVDAMAASIKAAADAIAIVSVHWVNNETGVIQPIAEIAKVCHDQGVLLHVDATQAVGRMPVTLADIPIDMMTFAAHKFHGPKGVGGLYVRPGKRVQPLTTGGPQERERRGGTENVPGIVGMGVAARHAQMWLRETALESLDHRRDMFERDILKSVPGTSVNASGAPRLWSTSNIAFDRLEAEAILLLLSERGIYASAGAACSSGSLDPSPVLLAMGVPESQAHGSVRFSFSRLTTDAEIAHALAVIPACTNTLRSSSSFAIEQ